MPPTKIRLGDLSPKAAAWHPSAQPDGSGVGVNWVDAWLKPLKGTLDDGRKVSCKRRGLMLTLKVGDRTGEGLLRRLEHGPEPEPILRAALAEAAAACGVEILAEDGGLHLVLGD